MDQFHFFDIEQLEDRISSNEGLLLVHFTSSMVTSCSFMRRSLALIAPEFRDQLKFAEVEVRLQEVEYLRHYLIRTVPTLVIFDETREVERLERILLPAELRIFFKDTVAFYGVPQPAPRQEDPGNNS